ncbi:hypothetical protein TruAng_011409 [Truncatella angustata]|nr:hypothetical protein TruAng_011409 [Truncatella angustata]
MTGNVLPTDSATVDLDLIAAINAARISKSPNAELETKADQLYQANHSFAVYGTLGPGKPNHHHISDIKGTWTDDAVTGKLVQSGWGAAMGFPALLWSQQGDAVPVQLLRSDMLPNSWDRLDTFEGAEYSRVLVPLVRGGVANIYAHADR